MLKLLYFFSLVDSLGRAQEQIALPKGVNDVAALLARLGKMMKNTARPCQMPASFRSSIDRGLGGE